MWTKTVIKQFKEAISIDNGDGIVKIGYGESLTIRVPTHPDGKCIVWEFATDNYDIGFGLFFEVLKLLLLITYISMIKFFLKTKKVQ